MVPVHLIPGLTTRLIEFRSFLEFNMKREITQILSLSTPFETP